MPDQFSPRRRPTRQPPHAAASKHSSDHVGARRRPVELCSDFCIAPSSTEQWECTCHSLSRLCALLSRYGTPHTCTDCNFHDRNAFRSGMMALVHRGMQCAGATRDGRCFPGPRATNHGNNTPCPPCPAWRCGETGWGE